MKQSFNSSILCMAVTAMLIVLLTSNITNVHAQNDCPNTPLITTDRIAVCSGESVTINGLFGTTGDLTGRFEIKETSGAISTIRQGEAFSFPISTACDPITYKFTAKAFCESGAEIKEASEDDLTIFITLYPEFNQDWIRPHIDNCDTPPTLKTICPNYLLTNETVTANWTSWEVIYKGDLTCFSQEIKVNACNSGCAVTPRINSNQLNTCSGESLTISTSFVTPSNALESHFNIRETSGAITNIEANTPFDLPTNTGCDPITYTFTGEAICETGEVIPGIPEDLTLTVTVYPEFNPDLLEIMTGNCESAGFITTNCYNYFIQPPNTLTEPQSGQSGIDNWEVRSLYGNNSCSFTIPIEIAYECKATTGGIAIEDISNTHILLYPNPILSGHNIKLETQFPENTSHQYKITDIYGRQILVAQKLQPKQRTQNIDLPQVPAGIYFLQIHNDQQQLIHTEKISIH